MGKFGLGKLKSDAGIGPPRPERRSHPVDGDVDLEPPQPAFTG